MGVQVVLLAELDCDRDAGEILAPVTLHRVDVEENGQGREQTEEDEQEHADLNPLAVHIRMPETEKEEETEVCKCLHMNRCFIWSSCQSSLVMHVVVSD